MEWPPCLGSGHKEWMLPAGTPLSFTANINHAEEERRGNLPFLPLQMKKDTQGRKNNSAGVAGEAALVKMRKKRGWSDKKGSAHKHPKPKKKKNAAGVKDIARNWKLSGSGVTTSRDAQEKGKHHKTSCEEQAHGQDFGGENILLRAWMNYWEMATRVFLFWLSRLALPLKNGKA